jgi:hypothetical protein
MAQATRVRARQKHFGAHHVSNKQAPENAGGAHLVKQEKNDPNAAAPCGPPPRRFEARVIGNNALVKDLIQWFRHMTLSPSNSRDASAHPHEHELHHRGFFVCGAMRDKPSSNSVELFYKRRKTSGPTRRAAANGSPSASIRTESELHGDLIWVAVAHATDSNRNTSPPESETNIFEWMTLMHIGRLPSNTLGIGHLVFNFMVNVDDADRFLCSGYLLSAGTNKPLCLSTSLRGFFFISNRA